MMTATVIGNDKTYDTIDFLKRLANKSQQTLYMKNQIHAFICLFVHIQFWFLLIKLSCKLMLYLIKSTLLEESIGARPVHIIRDIGTISLCRPIKLKPGDVSSSEQNVQALSSEQNFFGIWIPNVWDFFKKKYWLKIEVS